MPRDRKNSAAVLLSSARMKPGRFAPRIRRFAPVGVAAKRKGTRKAGREYFQACIIEAKGLPPVTAAAAEGDRPTGGETSLRTAK